MITKKPNAGLTVLMMYADEPCRICGEMITSDDVHTAVYAGYAAGGNSRSAHRECWDNRGQQSDWAYPTDDHAQAGAMAGGLAAGSAGAIAGKAVPTT